MKQRSNDRNQMLGWKPVREENLWKAITVMCKINALFLLYYAVSSLCYVVSYLVMCSFHGAVPLYHLALCSYHLVIP